MGRDIPGIHTSVKTMQLTPLAYQVAVLVLTHAQHHCLTHRTFREPANSDIQVSCGTQRMALQMLLCPVYFCGYNESMMALNGQHRKEQCKGIADWTVDPPVLKFNFSIREEEVSACSNQLTVIQEVGTGVLSDFSNIQFINISGKINSIDPDTGTITYREEMMYIFSCRYPLQYLVSNITEMSVHGTSLAVNDKNSSFISTLSMALYSDSSYTSALQIPEGGIELKTRIFVQVAATELSNRFNVILDRCYASTTSISFNSIIYDLFVGCDRDGQTIIAVNGLEHNARFSFEAFRFVQHQTSGRSTFYLHCSTRLCERSVCPAVVQNCTTNWNSRKRRNAENDQSTTVSDIATVSSGPITTRVGNDEAVEPGVTQQTRKNGTMLAVAIVAGILGALLITLAAFIAYIIFKSNRIISKAVPQAQE